MTTAPTFDVICDGEPSDAAIAALARLLLAAVDGEENDGNGQAADHNTVRKRDEESA